MLWRKCGHTCAHCCYEIVHCGIWDWCNVEFVQQLCLLQGVFWTFLTEACWSSFALVNLFHYCHRLWFVTCSTTSHCLIQMVSYCPLTAQKQTSTEFESNNTTFFIREDTFQNVVWKMAASFFKIWNISKTSIPFGNDWKIFERSNDICIVIKKKKWNRLYVFRTCEKHAFCPKPYNKASKCETIWYYNQL